MKGPARRGRQRVRAALDATAVPIWSGPPRSTQRASGLHFIRAPGFLPRGRRVYAVGDVHGCKDKLVALHAEIASDLAARPTVSATLVHLGDYIDQGPDSAGVITLLAEGPQVTGARVVNLMGDHERMLIDALAGDQPAATDWLWAGGRDALRSWGLNPELPRDQWESALPHSHLSFLRGLKLSHQEGDYFFVHAGIRPGFSLGEQTVDDLTTMRQPFLWTESDLGSIVVHGHSNNPSPIMKTNRIALDTGAAMGGKLTCAILEDEVVAFIGV